MMIMSLVNSNCESVNNPVTVLNMEALSSLKFSDLLSVLVNKNHVETPVLKISEDEDENYEIACQVADIPHLFDYTDEKKAPAISHNAVYEKIMGKAPLDKPHERDIYVNHAAFKPEKGEKTKETDFRIPYEKNAETVKPETYSYYKKEYLRAADIQTETVRKPMEEPVFEKKLHEIFNEQNTQINRPNVQVSYVKEEKTFEAPNIMNQVAKAISSYDPKAEKVVVNLKPEHLGNITLVVENTEKGYVASLYAQRDEVRKILDSSIGEITTMLSDKLIRVERIVVESMPGSSTMENALDDGRGGRNNTEQNYDSQKYAIRNNHSPPKDEELKVIKRNNSGLNIYI